MIQALVKHGANVSGGDGTRFTPLHYAAMTGREAAVELLLQLGAHVDAVTSSGTTPLHYASYFGQLRAVAKLAEFGANLLRTSDAGTTPLAFATATSHAHQMQTAELLRRLLGVDAPAMDGLEVFATKTLHF